MQSRGIWLKWIGRITIGIIALLLILGISGMLYQRQAMASDLEAYPAPGEMVDVGDFQMHLHCEGTGSPTIVFEAGLGDYSASWWTVRETITQEARTCVYDRAGLGWSDFTNSIASSDDVVENLHTLLQNAGETAPYIFVGHSAGGVSVREYAQQYPDDVVGLVLVDSSHENQQLRFPEEITSLGNSLTSTLRICQLIAPTGLIRVAGIAENFVDDFDGDDNLRQEAIALFNRTHTCTAISNEYTGLIAEVSQDTRPQSLGDLPIVVLTQGIGSDPADFPDSVSPEAIEQMDIVWVELQEELVALSSNSSHIIVEDASHYIHHDRPDVLIEAIQQILSMVEES